MARKKSKKSVVKKVVDKVKEIITPVPKETKEIEVKAEEVIATPIESNKLKVKKTINNKYAKIASQAKSKESKKVMAKLMKQVK